MPWTFGAFAVGVLSDVVFRGPTGVAPSLACVFAAVQTWTPA